jgi:dTDP-4-amino-4,6-dideoxygalactose transaminase
MAPTRLSVLPPLPFTPYARRPARRLPFPLEEPRSATFSLGRHALWHGVRAVGLREGDEVLVPAYHHGSEVEALVQAGVRCRFYEATDDLQPDEAALEAMVGPRTRALVVIHYLGFAQDAPRWRAWCDRHGLRLIEDAAQAWLAARDGRPVGSLGDVAIFCLYKTFGLPDGAAVVADGRVGAPAARPERGVERLLRRHGRWLGMRSRAIGDVAARLERPRPYVPAEHFALGDPDRPASAATTFLLPRIADPAAGDGRRERYTWLLDRLGDRVPRPFAQVGAGDVPHAFPIMTEHRAELMQRLQAAGIRAFAFWSYAHPLLSAEAYPVAARRRATTVVLPVHQELRRKDLERIAAATGSGRRRTPS